MQKENKFHKTKKDRHGEYYDHKNNLKKESGIKKFSILPHPTTLESYETISPGMIEKIGHMIIKEQEFRHKKELLYMRGLQNIYRLGQLLTMLLSIALIYITIIMVTEYYDYYLATLISITGFTFMIIAHLSSVKYMYNIKEFKRKHDK
jgi:uncharacterized membrane protein